MNEEQFKEHAGYLNTLKSKLDKLSDVEKKYVHLCPPLDAPRNEDGSIDYSRISTSYRRHLINFDDTILPVHAFCRIPSMLKEIIKGVKKDSRRLSKEDYLLIRKVIINQLDELESLCSTDYDYKD